MSGLPHNETSQYQPTCIGSLKLDPQPDRLAHDATRRTLSALARRFFGRAGAAAVLNISEDVLRHMRANGVELHASTAMTARYSHLAPARLVEAANLAPPDGV